MKDEIKKLLEEIEKDYLKKRDEEEKEELNKIFKEVEEEAQGFVWLS